MGLALAGHTQSDMTRIRFILDVFPHMDEAWIGSWNLRFHVFFHCLHVHGTDPIYARWEAKTRFGPLEPCSVNTALENRLNSFIIDHHLSPGRSSFCGWWWFSCCSTPSSCYFVGVCFPASSCNSPCPPQSSFSARSAPSSSPSCLHSWVQPSSCLP